MLQELVSLVPYLVALCIGSFTASVVSFRRFASNNRESDSNGKNVAFLHPYCFGSGGGERVLWEAVSHLLSKRVALNINKIIIYTATIDNKPVSLDFVLNKVAQRFEIEIDPELLQNLQLVPLYHHKWIEPKYHKFASLFTQSLTTVILAFEGLYRCVPHIFIDTTGFAFTYPVARGLFGCRVMSYTHYPTISTDMIERVSNKESMYNNPGYIANSPVLSRVKIEYYRLFALLYALHGWFAHTTLVNSRWTENHIKSIWFLNKKSSIRLVYPPCNTDCLGRIFDAKSLKTARKKDILSVGQFRPEKNHLGQVRAFAKFLEKSGDKHSDARLVVVGGVRNEGDQMRVNELKELIRELGVADNVVIEENLSFDGLLGYLKSSFVGLHAMKDEHFGICVCEYMMSWLVVLAHCSGGPESDIIGDRNDGDQTLKRTERGFLATKEDEYAAVLQEVFDKFEGGKGWMEMRKHAGHFCRQNFTSERFKKEFEEAFSLVCEAK